MCALRSMLLANSRCVLTTASREGIGRTLGFKPERVRMDPRASATRGAAYITSKVCVCLNFAHHSIFKEAGRFLDLQHPSAAILATPSRMYMWTPMRP